MNPTEKTEKKAVDSLFYVGLLIKGAGGLSELVAGIGALFLTTNSVLSIARFLVGNTLSSDPDNPIADYILNAVAGYKPVYTNIVLFVYLAGHAAINLFLVTMLLKKKMWAYPLALAIFGVLVAIEIWQVVQTWSLSLGVFTAFDLIVIALIHQEYGYMQRKRRRSRAS